MGDISTRPVTKETWADCVRLFEARGGPSYCWCAPYRFRDAQHMSAAEKKTAMHRLVERGTPIGVLAYDDGEPIGWCSIGPRESYAKLERSRTMPRKTPAETPTWTVLCFFIARSHRKQGVARALLEGAVAHARASGAAVVEGYPFDTAGVTGTHFGHSSVFRAARLVRDAADRRWSLRLSKRR